VHRHAELCRAQEIPIEIVREPTRDDAEARADLLDTKRRVEKILADLAVLRAASQLYLRKWSRS
jgi:hypothetical protein